MAKDGNIMGQGPRDRPISRLLIVEDEPLIAFDAEYLLSDHGFHIVATLDRVGDAVALIEGGAAIDLVLADIDLADGSGTDVARAAKAVGIPVLFVTGSCPPDAGTLATASLAKPYAKRDLVAAIQVVDAVLGGAPPGKLPNGLVLYGGPYQERQ